MHEPLAQAVARLVTRLGEARRARLDRDGPAVQATHRIVERELRDILQAAHAAPKDDPAAVRALRPLVYAKAAHAQQAGLLRDEAPATLVTELVAWVNESDARATAELGRALAQACSAGQARDVAARVAALLEQPMDGAGRAALKALSRDAQAQAVRLATPPQAAPTQPQARGSTPMPPRAAPSEGRPRTPAPRAMQRAEARLDLRVHGLDEVPMARQPRAQGRPALRAAATPLAPLPELTPRPSAAALELTPQSLDAVLPEQKFKLRDPIGLSARWGGRKMSMLSFAGQQVVLAPKSRGGSMGDFRYGVLPRGAFVAIKEMRRENKQTFKRPPSRAPTGATPRTFALSEARTTRALRKIIDAHVARFDAPGRPEAAGRDTLTSAREHSTPFEIFGVAEAPGGIGLHQDKLYMLMTPEVGSVDRLARVQMAAPVRAFMAMSLAAQIGTELEALHGEHAMHRDIKNDNILFSASGQFRLVDFGLTAPTDLSPLLSSVGAVSTAPTDLSTGLTRATGARQRVTTMLVPEGYASVDEAGNLGAYPRVGLALDIWTLAAAVVEMSNPSGMHAAVFHPPMFTKTDPDTGLVEEDTTRNSIEAHARMTMFNAWKEMIPRRADGTFDVSSMPGHRHPLSALFTPLARDNPKLCELLLGRALETDASKRIGAAQLAPLLRQLMAEQPQLDERRRAAVAIMGGLDATRDPALRRDVAAFQDYVQAHPRALAAADEPPAKPRFGLFRNLVG